MDPSKFDVDVKWVKKDKIWIPSTTYTIPDCLSSASTFQFRGGDILTSTYPKTGKMAAKQLYQYQSIGDFDIISLEQLGQQEVTSLAGSGDDLDLLFHDLWPLVTQLLLKCSSQVISQCYLQASSQNCQANLSQPQLAQACTLIAAEPLVKPTNFQASSEDYWPTLEARIRYLLLIFFTPILGINY